MTCADARCRAAVATAAAVGLGAVALLVALGWAPPAAATAADAVGADAPPRVDAEAWTLVDAETGASLAAHRAGERLPVASATKLMTALLALERAEPDDVYPAPGYDAAPVESQIGLARGERMAVADLLAALMLESANDAAATLAVGLAGSQQRFVTEMNRRARQLGLEDTSYADPIGFDDPDSYSTAADLALLARRLMQSARFRDIVDDERARLRSGEHPRVVDNRNELVGAAPHVDGVKTGHTLGAGYVLVGSAERDGARVVSVVLGAPTENARDRATRQLIDHGLDSYADRRVVRAGAELAQAAVAGRDGEEVALVARRGLSLPLLPGERVARRLRAPEEVTGPLPAGEPAGYVAVVRGGEVVDRVPLVTAAAVPGPAGLAATLKEIGGRPVLVAVGAFGVTCVAALAVIGVRRRRTSPRNEAAA